MIAAWMGYCLLITATLALVAWLVERIATVQRWPRRWVWAGALLLSGLLVAVSPRRATAPVVPVSATEPAVRRVERPAPLTRVAEQPELQRRNTTALVRWRAIGERIQRPLLVFWLAGSLGVLGVLGHAVLALAARRRRWRSAEVNGAEVFVAEQDGPAVVGLVQPRIVLPEWALALEPEALALMLQHEREHLRALDPLLSHAAGLLLLALPWNLPLWWLVRRLRLAIEVDCDARVLAERPVARRYGEVLLEVASRRSRRLAAAPALLEHTTALGRRIMALHPRPPRFPRWHNAALAAPALALVAFAGYERPPELSARPALQRPPGWVVSTDFPSPLLIDSARPELALPQVFPALQREPGPTVAMLARDSEGRFVRGVLGRNALGPVRERLPVTETRGIDRLAGALTAGNWREADEALFGEVPSLIQTVVAQLPLQQPSRTQALELRRLPAGAVSPGVVYLFVMTLRPEVRRP